MTEIKDCITKTYMLTHDSERNEDIFLDIVIYDGAVTGFVYPKDSTIKVGIPTGTILHQETWGIDIPIDEAIRDAMEEALDYLPEMWEEIDASEARFWEEYERSEKA